MIELVAALSMLIGLAAMLLGSFGLLRFPDFYSRTHAASMTDTAGAGFILFALALHAGWDPVLIKLALLLVWILVTSPTATHALARAALADGHEPQLGKRTP